MKTNVQILILDLGSQYTLLIRRRMEECGVSSIVLSPKPAARWLTGNDPKGIILSGGAASVYDKDFEKPPDAVVALIGKVPVLCICLGMHWLARLFGGEVERAQDATEYSESCLKYSSADPLFKDLKRNGKLSGDVSTVWASHGDSVVVMPPAFRQIGWTDSCQFAAISKPPIWGVQFHPEVEQTECGLAILGNFLGICGAVPDWSPGDIITRIRDEAREVIPKGEKCVLAFSGGVDSSTTAAILGPDLGERLIPVTIDGGNLREGELEEIIANADAVGCRTMIVDKSSQFPPEIAASIDAEVKRRIFQRLYFGVLEDIAQEVGARVLIQGTLAPDVIESGKVGGASHIVTHHNVGKTSLIRFDPLHDRFKYEVRALARHLGLPPSISERQPFPGPGLFCRIVGISVTPEELGITRWADAKVRTINREDGIENEYSELVVARLGVKTAGVKGDGRSYDYGIGVRAVITSDFMTCWGYQFPPRTRRRIDFELPKHPRVAGVYFSETNKPPARTEFE